MMRTLIVLLGLVLVTGCATPPPEAPAPPAACSSQCKCHTPVEVTTPTVLVFTAKWCPACPAAKPGIAQLIEKGVNVVVIDCDERPDLVSKYNVTSIPLFICEGERTNDPDVAMSWFE